MENGVTSWVRSTIRTVGMMPYITPRHSATESSTKPKSVMNTIVGGYFSADSVAAQDGTARISKIITAKTIRTRAEPVHFRSHTVIGHVPVVEIVRTPARPL